MCRSRSAGTVSSEAGPQVIWVEELELALCRKQCRLSRPCRQSDVLKDGVDDERRRDQCDEPEGRIATRAAQDLRTPDPFHQLRPGVMPRWSALLVLVEGLTAAPGGCAEASMSEHSRGRIRGRHYEKAASYTCEGHRQPLTRRRRT